MLTPSGRIQKPLAIDLFCGLGGWAEGFLAEGYDVIGFDIEARPYPGQLVLQDALTLHGSQFRNAAVIVASPPCQTYSYMAMPWSRSKELAAWYRESSERIGQLNALFDACFRIQREACAAAGRSIPMVVENVKGAQPWVGRARAHFGSFYLWGDIDSVGGSIVAGGIRFGNVLRAARRGRKLPGMSWSGSDRPGYKAQGFNTTADQRMREEIKGSGGTWWKQSHGKPANGVNPREQFDGVKQEGSGALRGLINGIAKLPSGSSRRKLASAKIAMIPPPLSRHVAHVLKPPEGVKP